MGLYRCQNDACSNDPHGRLIFDFEAAAPVCPKCGADGRKPEHRNTVIRREVIHLHIPDKAGPDVGMKARLRIACVARGTLAGKRGTGEARAVTCPACQKTPEFQACADEFDTPPELDLAITVDREKAMLVPAEGGAAGGPTVTLDPNCCP